MSEGSTHTKKAKAAGIGPVIKEMASIQGMTIVQLAKKSGVASGNLNNIINNLSYLTAINSLLISAALGVDDNNLQSLYEMQARVVVEEVLNSKLTKETIKKIRDAKDDAPDLDDKVDSKVRDLAQSILKKG